MRQDELNDRKRREKEGKAKARRRDARKWGKHLRWLEAPNEMQATRELLQKTVAPRQIALPWTSQGRF